MKENPALQPMDERIQQLEEEIRKLQSELTVLRSQKLVEALKETDGPLPRENKTVVRTAAGLTVKGSRLTLYYLMDAIQESNSLKNIRDIYELTDEEMLDILDYIHLNKAEVETEYQRIVKLSDENRKYWEAKNRDLMDKTYQQREGVRAKLKELREHYHPDQKP